MGTGKREEMEQKGEQSNVEEMKDTVQLLNL